jgi:hypothetical protein
MRPPEAPISVCQQDAHKKSGVVWQRVEDPTVSQALQVDTNKASSKVSRVCEERET